MRRSVVGWQRGTRGNRKAKKKKKKKDEGENESAGGEYDTDKEDGEGEQKSERGGEKKKNGMRCGESGSSLAQL